MALRDINVVLQKSSDSLQLKIQIFVAGAGRGPLVDEVFKAEKELLLSGLLNFQIQIWAIEKNPNAMISLEYCNETKF